MKHSLLAKVAGTAAALALVVTASAGLAQSPTKEETKCRGAIAKNTSKYIKTILKDGTGCFKNAAKGKLTVGGDCTDVGDGSFSDAKGKAKKGADKLIASIGTGEKSKCLGQGNVLALFSRCKSPAHESDDLGATDGIDDFDELADCLIAMSDAYVSQALLETMGDTGASLPSELGKGAGKCLGTIGKGISKVITTAGKGLSKCQATKDKEFGGLNYDCAGQDPKTKIADTITKANEGITKACTALDDDPDDPEALPLPYVGATSQEELAALNLCGQTPAQLHECVSTQVGDRLGRGLAAMGFELPATCDALSGVDVFINAGAGEMNTNTNLRTGWNGLGHNVDVVDLYHGSVGISCDNDCRNCSVSIDPQKDEPFANCRCGFDSSVACDTIEGSDATCAAIPGQNNDVCHCMFGPPLGLNASLTPVCVVNRIVSELDGNADAGSGESTTSVDNQSNVYLGIGQLDPCPLCVGDTTINDAVSNGVCEGGQRDGQPCNGNALHPTFNNAETSPGTWNGGTSSYDCMPLAGEFVASISLDLTLTTGTQEIPFSQNGNKCTGGVDDCPCLTCDLDATVGCNADSECDFATCAPAAACAVNADCLVGLCTGATCSSDSCSENPKVPCTIDSDCVGACDTIPSGTTVEQNACDGNGVCGADGTCEEGPFTKFCDAMVRGNGGGIVGCTDDQDCIDATNAGVCEGNDCGECLLGASRACHTDPLSATGSARGPYGSELASAFCVGSTGNTVIDGASGNPSGSTIVIDFDYEAKCCNGDAFEIPTGANCTACP